MKYKHSSFFKCVRRKGISEIIVGVFLRKYDFFCKSGKRGKLAAESVQNGNISQNALFHRIFFVKVKNFSKCEKLENL